LAEDSASANWPYGPYCGEESYITLPIPSGAAGLPNGQAFHPNNTHFVTVEVQQWANVGDVRDSIFENEDVDQRKSGGAYARE
ncbi:hypothetical protein OFL77_27500, partial [Escherichia coli]|uniref:hypothetical protein n=1 Tax=Escherichia coli TaxID=562 RepID=UPI0021E006FF